MSVIQMTPCILAEDWAGFVEWCAQTFDMPVQCRFDNDGWGRLAASSKGLTVIADRHFKESGDGESTVVELEVTNLDRHVERAVAAGATLVRGPQDLGPDSRHASLRTPQGVLLWLFQTTVSGTDDALKVNDGPIHFTVSNRYDAPIAEVFAAATQKQHLEKTFCDEVSGDLAQGESPTWHWDEYGTAALNVVEFRPNEHVAFVWEAHAQQYNVRSQFSFATEGDRTLVTITETGWSEDPRGLQGAFAHCEGWTSFLANLKAYLEYGVEPWPARSA